MAAPQTETWTIDELPDYEFDFPVGTPEDVVRAEVMKHFSATQGPKPAPPTLAQEWGPTALRVAGAVAGVTPLTGALSGALGEGAAQFMEGDFDPYKLASQTALGALGPIKTGATLLRAAIGGGVKGMAGAAVPSLVEEGKMPSAGQLTVGATLGSILGAGANKFDKYRAIRATEGRDKELALDLSRQLNQPVDWRNKLDLDTAMELIEEQRLAREAVQAQRVNARAQAIGQARQQALQTHALQQPRDVMLDVLGNRQGQLQGQMVGAKNAEQVALAQRPEQRATLARAIGGRQQQLESARGANIGAKNLDQVALGQRYRTSQQFTEAQSRWLQGLAGAEGRRQQLLREQGTSDLLDRAAATVRTPEVDIPEPSLLELASRTLRSQRGSAPIISDVARKVMAGGDPEDLAGLPVGDLMRRRYAATVAGNSAEADRISKAIANRVPKEAVAQGVAQMAGQKAAAQVMRTPPPSAITGDNAFARANMVTNSAIQQAEAFAQSAASKEDKRLYRQVAQAFLTDELDSGDVQGVLQKYNMSLTEFIGEYKNTAREWGQGMNKLSQFRKRLEQLGMAGDETAATVLGELGGPRTRPERAFEAAYDAINAWRGMMTTQPVTAMRNFRSTGLASVVEAFDEAVTGVYSGHPIRGIQRGATLLGTEVRHFTRGLEDVGRWIQGMERAGGNDAALNILKLVPAEYARLINNPSAEAHLGKWATKLNWLNTLQEHYWRKAIFESQLINWAREQGLDTRNLEAIEYPKKVITEAVNKSLKLTFANRPETGIGRAWVSAHRVFPAFYLVDPFPRFQANAIEYFMQHSPLGLYRLATKNNTVPLSRIAAEATTGTVMLGLAMALRASPLAGERWSNVKLSENTREDVKTIAPFSQYLFYAQLLNDGIEHGEVRMSQRDLAAGLQSAALRGGAGWSVVDLVYGTTEVKNMHEVATAIMGNLLGAYSTAARQVKDAAALLDPAEAYYRDIREPQLLSRIHPSLGMADPLLAPTVANLPLVNQLLPSKPNPLTGEPLRADHPVLRQLTGSTIDTLTPVEQEADRLGLEPRTIYPRTGVAKVDRAVSRFAGPYISGRMERLMGDPRYQGLDYELQQAVANDEIDRTRHAAQTHLLRGQRPDLRYLHEVEKLRRSKNPRDIARRRALGIR